MSKIYCGIDKLPKNHRYGTMVECAKKGQIRYYGLKKIDSKSIKAAKTKDKKTVTREKLLLKLVEMRGTIKKNKGLIQMTKDKKEKEKYAKIIKDIEKDMVGVSDKLKMIEAERQASKNKE